MTPELPRRPPAEETHSASTVQLWITINRNELLDKMATRRLPLSELVKGRDRTRQKTESQREKMRLRSLKGVEGAGNGPRTAGPQRSKPHSFSQAVVQQREGKQKRLPKGKPSSESHAVWSPLATALKSPRPSWRFGRNRDSSASC